MTEANAAVVELTAEYLGSTGRYSEECGVCCRTAAFCDGASLAVGRITGVRLSTGMRHSVAVCADCAALVLAGDWAGLERLVVQYQAAEWRWWTAPRHRRRARTVAQQIAAWNEQLFANLADPNDAPRGAQHD